MLNIIHKDVFTYILSPYLYYYTDLRNLKYLFPEIKFSIKSCLNVKEEIELLIDTITLLPNKVYMINTHIPLSLKGTQVGLMFKEKNSTTYTQYTEIYYSNMINTTLSDTHTIRLNYEDIIKIYLKLRSRKDMLFNIKIGRINISTVELL